MNKWGIGLFSLNLLSCISLLLGACSFNKPQIDYYAPGTEAVVSELSYVNHIWYCEPLQLPERPVLHSPIDLAVSQDGQTVYATSKEPQKFGIYRSPAVSESQSYRPADLQRRFIYRLKQRSTQPDILKHNGQPPLSCVLGNELEMDSQDRLYAIDEVNQGIYRVEANQLEKLLVIDENSGGSFDVPTPGIASRKIYFGPPHALKTSSSHLYYGISAKGTAGRESKIRRFNLGSKGIETIYTSSHLQFYILSIVDNKPFIFFFPSIPQKTESTLPLQGLTFEQIQEKTKEFGNISDVIGTETEGQWIFYATDSTKHVVYKLATSPEFEFKDFSVFVGVAEKAGYQDGNGPTAQFDSPTALSLDGSGNLYVADTGNHAIRKITPDGQVITLYKAPKAIQN